MNMLLPRQDSDLSDRSKIKIRLIVSTTCEFSEKEAESPRPKESKH